MVDGPTASLNISILHDSPLSNPGSFLINLEPVLCVSSFMPLYVHHLYTSQQPPKVDVISPNYEETRAQRGHAMSSGSQSW